MVPYRHQSNAMLNGLESGARMTVRFGRIDLDHRCTAMLIMGWGTRPRLFVAQHNGVESTARSAGAFC
jgi:hypothetical protein